MKFLRSFASENRKRGNAVTVIIDRFENGFAVVELPDGRFTDLPRTLVPGAAEGDVVTISIDKEETEKRKKKIKGLMDELWAD